MQESDAAEQQDMSSTSSRENSAPSVSSASETYDTNLPSYGEAKKDGRFMWWNWGCFRYC